MDNRNKTKKLINQPDDVISELIEGMIAAHPEILMQSGDTKRAIVARNGPRQGKVGIVIGGGSGHEPAFSGYVGKGLADAAAIGNVFASPSPDQICDAAFAADGGAGIVFLYGNYTGDVMNFDMASEALTAHDIKSTSVLVTDDVASAPQNRGDERRGIAGGFFVFKCAGAAADLGYDFDAVIRLAKHANAMTRSSGVALGACSLPQTCRANFEIGPEEMEIGMGIHGEPGIARTKLQSADEVTDQLLDLLLTDMPLKKGDKIAVLVNGLGATSLMELYILRRQLGLRLKEIGVEIHHSWVGNYITALEMAGASISVLKLDDELTKLFDHPCETPALQVGKVVSAPEKSHRIQHRKTLNTLPVQNLNTLKKDGEITPQIFTHILVSVANVMHENRDWLCELDGVIGDGDHGIAMDTGWGTLRKRLRDIPDKTTITMICESATDVFLNAVGASIGPLYATGFEYAGRAVDDRLNLDKSAMVRWLEAMFTGISERGGAKIGDKTMIDVWAPAVEAAKRQATILDCLQAAETAAKKGMESTRAMQASKGRSAKLGARSVGHIDPGAASAYLIFCAMNAVVQDKLR